MSTIESTIETPDIQTTVAFNCSAHGAQVAVFSEYESLKCGVSGCGDCLKGLSVALRERRFVETVEQIKAEIAFSNSEPDWIGPRPGDVPIEAIEAAAREQMALEDEEFDRGFNESKEERGGW